MSDPMKEQTLERLLQKTRVLSARGGGVVIMFPGSATAHLPRDKAVELSQALLQAIADGEPSWEGWT